MKICYISIFFFFLSGCFCPAPKPTSLRISFNNYPITLDPRKSGDFTSASLICLLYEGLTRCGPEEAIHPGIAYKIETSSEGTLYTFHLRPTFWTDGTPVTAIDFEKSWKKSINPSFPCLSSYLFFPIHNVEKYIQGKVSLEEVGIQALDPYTLRVKLERPTPYFLSLTAFPVYLPIPSHIEEKNENWDQIRKDQLVCNGPFLIKKMLPNNEICLVKNKQFWNKKDIFLDSIHISILSDETTTLQMFERGELDFAGGPLSPLPPDALKKLQNQGKLRFISMDASTFCTFNNQTFPFYNTSLRQAFCYAIDRKAIIDETLQTGQIPAATPLPPTLFPPVCRKPTKALKTDVKAAKELLQKGLKELNISSSDLENITLYYKQGQDNQRLAQTLQKNWKKTLGISIKIEQLDQKHLLQNLQRREYQISLASWICQFHDPISLLDRFRIINNPKNYPGWTSEAYVTQLEKASRAINTEERNELLKEAEEIFMRDTPIAPLFHWTVPYISNDKLKEIATTSTGGILFDQFKIAEPSKKTDTF